MAGGDLAFEWRRTGHPLKSLASIKRAPDPARVCCRRARYACVKAARICRIDAQVLFEAKSADPGNDWVSKSRRVWREDRGIVDRGARIISLLTEGNARAVRHIDFGNRENRSAGRCRFYRLQRRHNHDPQRNANPTEQNRYGGPRSR